MPKLYIANTTKQHHQFVYRIPEDGRNTPTMQEIPVGQCVQIYRDDTSSVLEAIIEQHTRYGLVPVNEIDRTKDFIGLAYQFDQPIDVEKIIRALTHNDQVLKQLGDAQRKDVAVAISQGIEQGAREAGANAGAVEVTVEEVDRQDSTSTSLNETIEVVREGGRQRRTRGS